MNKSRFLSFLLLLVCHLASGQAVSFKATADAKKVLENSYFTVKYTIENAKGKNFNPPSFEPFKVIGRPSSMSSHSSVNGVVTRSISYTYTLQAKKIGIFEIGKAQIRVGSDILESNPVTIEVVKSNNKAASQSEEMFIKTIISDSIAYVGQQLILDYKLYTTLDVRSNNFLTDNDFDGFYVQPFRKMRNSYVREIVDGVEYYTKSLRRLALFPQQTGTYTIDPVDVNVGIATKNSSRGFFFSSQLIPRRLSAEGITIPVLNAPADINNPTGAVGQYEMQLNKTKRSITTDEAITVIMQIIGNGDSKTVKPPVWDLPEGLVMYDPNIIEDEVFDSSDEIKHRKTFEYLIVAEKPGRYSLEPSFNYFDPDSSKHIFISRRLPPINVIQGSNTLAAPVQKEEASISDIYRKTNLKIQGSSWHGSHWHILILSILFCGLAAIFIYNNFLNRSGKRNPEEIRKNKAYSVAKKRLERALELKSDGQNKAFYEEISIAIKKYLLDKHGVSAMHMKKTDLALALETTNLSSEQIQQIMTIIDHAELAMYTPGNSSNTEMIYNQTIELISALEI